MRKSLVEISAACLVGLILSVANGAGAATIEEMLETKSLVSAYNPELLDFLLEVRWPQGRLVRECADKPGVPEAWAATGGARSTRDGPSS